MDMGRREQRPLVGPELEAKRRRKGNKPRRKKQKSAASEETFSFGTPEAARCWSSQSMGLASPARARGGTIDENAPPHHVDASADRGGGKRANSGKKRPRESSGNAEGVGNVKVSQLQHPFPADYCDHFETPLQAYRDVEGALAFLAQMLGKKRKHLRIWDPYYCAGRTPRLLAQLGFLRVEHRNEDFYKVVETGKQPPHDVIVTNPPYSGVHKQRCLEYCKASGKPWFLLIPNYVATKDYYKLSVLGSAAGSGGEPFYVVPDTKYPFDHPEGTGHADTPFFGMWFVHCGSYNEEIFEAAKGENRGGVAVVRSLQELAQRGAVKTERRLNPRQRKALKKKLKLGEVSAGASGAWRG